MKNSEKILSAVSMLEKRAQRGGSAGRASSAAGNGAVDYAARRRRLMLALYSIIGAGLGSGLVQRIPGIPRGIGDIGSIRPIGDKPVYGGLAGGLVGLGAGYAQNKLRGYLGLDPMARTVAVAK